MRYIAAFILALLFTGCEQDHTDAEILYRRGTTLIETGDTLQAITTLLNARQADNDGTYSGKTEYAIGQLFESQHKHDFAMRHYLRLPTSNADSYSLGSRSNTKYTI